MPSDSDRSAPAVRVEDLGVVFRTKHESQSPPRGRFKQRLHRIKRGHQIEALKGVTFDVPAGSVFGVVGRNGAGKSTLFRVIAGIYAPTEGRVTLSGRVTPLLSLGLGFNRELTGRENVLLGGLANGLDAEFVQERYGEIVGFADIGDAIDYPMRTYSSGMFARVGFAVAAFLKPEILLIDEALGAGDAEFKTKCRDKISELCESEHTTVMIVTHGLGMVKQLADRAIWIDRGRLIREGPADEIVDRYLGSLNIQAKAEADPEVKEKYRAELVRRLAMEDV